MLRYIKTQQRGFTIVELLVVIVVIAILASISIVAYNGIQSRAKVSAAQSAANSLDKKAEVYNAINGQYPTVAGSLTCGSAGTACASPTTTASDWFIPYSAAATQSTVLPTIAPTSPSTLWYFPSGTVGACIYYWDYQQNKVVPVTAGTPTVACPTTPTTSTTPATTTTATAV